MRVEERPPGNRDHPAAALPVFQKIDEVAERLARLDLFKVARGIDIMRGFLAEIGSPGTADELFRPMAGAAPKTLADAPEPMLRIGLPEPVASHEADFGQLYVLEAEIGKIPGQCLGGIPCSSTRHAHPPEAAFAADDFRLASA